MTRPRGDAGLEDGSARTSSSGTEQAGTAPPTARIALWDNARLLLILLVVFGHLIESIRGPDLIDAVYDVVYSFHIPAFLLISGWLARSDRLDREALKGTGRLIVTWLVAEGLWAVGRAAIGRDPIPSAFLVQPSWTLWFLVSLFLMRVLLPYVALLPLPVLAAVVVSLGVGLSGEIGTAFSASRTLALLPLFVLGWWLRRSRFASADWFLRPSVRVRIIAGVVAAAGVMAVLALTRLPDFTNQLLFWRRGYAAMGFDLGVGLGLRGLMLVLAASLSICLLLLIPRGRHWFSALGRNTLPVYLAHAPIVFVLRRLHIDDAIAATPVPLLVMLAIAIVLTLPLATAPVARVMRPLLEPDLLFRSLRPVALKG